MQRHPVRGLIGAVMALLALCPALSSTAAAQVTNLAAARRAIEEPRIVALETDLSATAQSGATDALARLLQTIAADPQMEPAAREWLLDRGLHGLAQLPPTAAARAAVLRLALRAPSVFVRADPDHGSSSVPLYDAGATARFVIDSWQRAAARDETGAALLAGQTSPVERFALRAGIAGPDPARAGIVDAFAAAPVSELARQRDTIIAAIGQGRRVDELALVTGHRLGDRELLDLVIGYADPQVALAAVHEVARVLDSVAALESLSVAGRRPEIASAALLEIGMLARQDGRARDFLYRAIDDPLSGPSAAAALGALHDPAVAPELGRRLRLARTEQSRRLFVLALGLDGSQSARIELKRFAEARTGSPQLQNEVRQWLAH
ncbi:MAG: hypothetical protein WAW79_07145 [Steroidobacteraceae bacterium]